MYSHDHERVINFFLQIFCHTATDVLKCPCLKGVRMVGDWWQMGDKTGK